MGLDFETGRMNRSSRLTWGLCPVKIVRESGETEYAFVRLSVGDYEAAVKAAFVRWLDEDVKFLAIGTPGHDAIKGTPRGMDWVEEDLGSMHQRAVDEGRHYDEAAIYLVSKSDRAQLTSNPGATRGKQLPMVYVIEDNHTSAQVTIEQMAAEMGTTQMLHDLKAKSEAKETAKLLSTKANRIHHVDESVMSGAEYQEPYEER
jgi:hypothetical protein